MRFELIHLSVLVLEASASANSATSGLNISQPAYARGMVLLSLPSFKLQYAVKHMRVKYQRRFRRREVIPMAANSAEAANTPTVTYSYFGADTRDTRQTIII